MELSCELTAALLLALASSSTVILGTETSRATKKDQEVKESCDTREQRERKDDGSVGQ